jgi:hypothetical protein
VSSRYKGQSQPTRNILNVPEDRSNNYSTQSPNKININDKHEEVSSAYRDKSPESNHADEKLINIPSNHYMVPAHTFRNYNFVPRSVPINFEAITSKDDCEELSNKMHRVLIENNRALSAMASNSSPKPIGDVITSMLASGEKDLEDYELIGNDLATDSGLIQDDSFELFVNMDNSSNEESSTLTRKKENKELIMDTGSLPRKDPNDILFQQSDGENGEMERKSEPLVKTFVSTASLNLSNFEKDKQNIPVPKKVIVDKNFVNHEKTFNANNNKGIQNNSVTNGACPIGEEKKEHFINDMKPCNEVIKTSIPIVETGLPFARQQQEVQSKIKPCLKTEKNPESWTTLIRTRSQSPAGRSSPSKLNVNFKSDAIVKEYEPSNHEHRVDYPRFKKIQISGTERKNNVANGHQKEINQEMRVEKCVEKEEVVVQKSETVVDGKDKMMN